MLSKTLNVESSRSETFFERLVSKDFICKQSSVYSSKFHHESCLYYFRCTSVFLNFLKAETERKQSTMGNKQDLELKVKVQIPAFTF